jgi:5-hydroxyisourate hydrolase-like protein (transthyretin family)
MRILNRIIRLSPSLVLTTAASLCISHVSAAAQTAQSSHAISGQVVNSVTGEPIARARVQLATQQAVLTDHDGRFEFDSLTEDSSYVFPSKPGYFAEDRAVLPQNGSITLRLIPEAIVFGTVTDQNGQPVQDLRVQLSKLEVHNGLRRWQPMQSTNTSVEGKFRFAELQAGQYSLATNFRIEGLPDAASSVAFVPVTFPPPTGGGTRGSLTLAPGDQVEANATTSMEKLYPVTGMINGLAPRSGGLSVTNEDGEIIEAPVTINPSGTFRSRLPSGSYRLSVRSFVEREQQQFEGTREITVGEAPLEAISITLAPPVTLPIDVEYQAVSTGTSTQTSTSAPPPYLNASLEDDDPRGLARSVPAQLRRSSRVQPLQPGDPMAFVGVEPGRYVLQTRSQPPWYVASATCGNLDLTRDAVAIAADAATACTVRLVYRDDSASLKWSISAGEGDNTGSLVFVAAIPLDNFIQPPELSVGSRLSPETPAEGSFEGLAPGRYLVMALTHQQELAYRDNEAMQRYLPLGQQVTLTRGGKSEVQLKTVTGEP